MNLKNFKKIHFIGIGGISMSGLAKLIKKHGFIVTGSDITASPETNELIKLGLNICIGDAPSLVQQADLIIYTNAVGKDNPDLILAKNLGKSILERAEFLGFVSNLYKNVIAISGTHGKTTTTSMIGLVFDSANLKPTIHIGGISNDFDSNMIVGKKHYFITEACEYNKSFLHIQPTVAVINNIEKDHMDCYHDFDELFATFQQFAHQTTECVILNGDLINKDSFSSKEKTIITFGEKETNTCYPINIKNTKGKYAFDCIYKEANLGRITLNIVGRHNILNALSCICVAMYYNIPFDIIATALNKFSGVGRRFETIFKKSKITMVHDYAHHPTEIKCSIDTAKTISRGRLIVIFEPHTYSRTLTLMEEFSTAFSKADRLIILPTYPAREMPMLGGDAIDLFYRVAENCKETLFFNHLNSLFNELDNSIQENDFILWLGAGTIYKFSKLYSEHLKELLKTTKKED